MKTLDLKFLVVLAMTCLVQKTMWFEAGPSGAKAWHPALPGLPGAAETPRGWSPVPAVGTWGSWGFPACVAPSDSAQKCLSSPGAVSTRPSQQLVSGVWAGPAARTCTQEETATVWTRHFVPV